MTLDARSLIQAERARVGAILGCEEAKGREQFAQELAIRTDFDLAAAKRLLAATPKASPVNLLAAAMARVANPAVGSDTDTDTGGDVAATVRYMLRLSGDLKEAQGR